MPRIRPARTQEDPAPQLEDHTPPTEPIEIDLPGEVEGSTLVDLAPVIEKKVEPEPIVETSPLQQQAEAQRRAEELQRANADMQRQIAERDAALKTERSRGDDAEYNSVLTAIAAEQAVLDKAETDYAHYAGAGDFQTAAKAQRIMSQTSARLDRLEDGKMAFEQRRAAPAPEVKPAPQAPLDFEGQIAKMPDSAKSWLRKHPEFMSDTALNEQISNAHVYLVKNKKIEAFSPKYFEALDDEFGFKAAPAEVEPQPQRRSMPVSAPVSRDAPSATGKPQPSSKMTLSQEERQIARTSFSSNMTNEQKELLYAQNKRKLQLKRANGEYPQSERN